ncbi:MAG: response regulator [Xenococcaceae cyanobacterium]
MAQDKEKEVRLQFLEEAQEYINSMESGLLGLGNRGFDRNSLDAVLRAAHSIKGGAAMMGFQTLSDLAHRLEDFFKVLKAGKQGVVDGDLERLLLSSVDGLRQVIALNRQGAAVEEAWLEAEVNPVFNQLHDRLGDPQPEDATTLVSAEVGEDMKVLLFETEVESCLQRLESVLDNPEMPCLREEFEIAAQELEGLGQMLDLPAFSSLCESVVQQLEAAPEQEEEIARKAIQEWRRSQAMVLIGQIEALPAQLDLTVDSAPRPQGDGEIFDESFDEGELTLEPMESSLESGDLIEAQDFFSSLEAISSSAQLGAEADKFEEELQTLSSSLVAPSTAQPAAGSKIVTARSEPQPDAIIAERVSETTDNTIRVSVKQLEQLSDLFGELTIERNGLDLQLRSLRELIGLLSRRVKVLEQSNSRLRTTYDKVETQTAQSPLSLMMTEAAKPSLALGGSNGQSTSDLARDYLTGAMGYHSQFDVLEMDRYSDSHLLSQEIMETVVQIQEVTKDIEIQLQDTEQTAREFTRTSKQMQTSITKVRMRPVSDLVGRFPRALRDMALQYGKQVELKVRGGSTLIDRTILEALSDPMLHLLRNAFDHGIEDLATRKARGKPEKGTIEIIAGYRGNQTVITIRDDGAGINLDKIRSRVEEMGLDEKDLAETRKHDLLELIFEPGFSTAEKVTNLSGRGVGMDVVRTNLRNVRGEIHVNTKPGLGTTFTITVPFTLSVVRVLLVESGGMLLAFPTNAVEEMLRLKPEMVLLSAGKEVLNWEGYMVPLIKLSKWLQFSSFHHITEPDTVPIINKPTVLMIAQGHDLIGIEVDRYWGEQEVTIRQVEGTIKMPPGFTGCTILGDGRVVPLVDAIALLHWINNDGSMQSPNQALQNPLVESDSEAMNRPLLAQAPVLKKTVMVVDDSINVRRFLALTLEKAGYRVEQAKDGQDALEKLRIGIQVQSVICDIEMPRLDGYGFLAHVKSDPNCKHLPIVMLTSRSGDKHRQLAINLGATSYFSKPFKEQELLQTLDELSQK